MINSINPKHPYVGKQHAKVEYLESVKLLIDTLSLHLTKSEIRDIPKKLQITKSSINEAQYLQAACELTVCLYFADKYGGNFIYEDKVNPPKDVDCSFIDNNSKYNIEVKCADFSVVDNVKNDDCFKMSALGRMPEYRGVVSNLQEIFNDSGKQLKTYKHLDNRMKDFLISAHGKFSDENYGDVVNVLLVCCDDAMDMTKWTSYLTGLQGLFTKDSFHSQVSFNKVDVVILSNLYHRHAKYQEKENITNNWDFASSFNILFCNPGRKSNKKKAIEHLYDIIPNFSKEVMNYPAAYELEALKLATFVNKELKAKNQHYFN
ncbi:hypothetical protein [Psychromonas aquimarina]|uniref:hypothetical protein n=1 Tax=Psychromonas aquimarina TaxID=444919 RepID=UPI0003F79973|nr:hypothetical protein [Psychromonas aquimarina]